ncbi:MAG: hypothetical protein H6Q13_372 [Bacteroidetes bacterium]|jgi:hypothetical protein|nr:hypothetical protein [Bacteroidota bacterium]
MYNNKYMTIKRKFINVHDIIERYKALITYIIHYNIDISRDKSAF